MKKTVLVFPNTNEIAEFILSNNIAGIVVDSKEKTIVGELTDEELEIAYALHQAEIIIRENLA